MSGTFVAVVGPSGSGKDSILEATRDALAAQTALTAQTARTPSTAERTPGTPGTPGTPTDIVFARRRITRPASLGEDHSPVSEREFGAAEKRGEFALTWRAHGLAYGLPAHLVDVVASGGVVVANVSRGVLHLLPAVFTTVRVVRVTVSDEVRLARIVARGRETAVAAAARVARPDPAPGCEVDLNIVNDGTLDEASAIFAAFLWQVRDAARAQR